jgi:signal transduction histidine kinase
VRDNGVGLSAGSNGHGLTNLRDRVEALGGTITVNGPPGTGTTLHASLPVGASHA